MSTTCKHFREYDGDRGDFEWCKGVEKKVACSGSLCACQFPQFFNVPKHRLEMVRGDYLMDKAQERALAVFELGVQK